MRNRIILNVAAIVLTLAAAIATLTLDHRSKAAPTRPVEKVSGWGKVQDITLLMDGQHQLYTIVGFRTGDHMKDFVFCGDVRDMFYQNLPVDKTDLTFQWNQQRECDYVDTVESVFDKDHEDFAWEYELPR